MAPFQDGSFRGVAFGTLAHSVEGGRRTITHEFPLKDVPFLEDLGLKARTFSMDLYVLGDDVSARRDELTKALEQKGPGTLVHPYLGVLTVQVTGYSLSETYDEQRIAKFSVTFVFPGKLESPKAVTSVSGSVSSLSTTSTLLACANASEIDVSSSKTQSQVTEIVGTLSDTVQTAAQQAAQPSSVATGTDLAATFQKTSSFVQTLGSVVELVSHPELMAAALADCVFQLANLGMTPFQAFRAYNRLLTDVQLAFTKYHFPESALGLTMSANLARIQDVMFTAVVTSAAAQAVDADYRTNDQALSARSDLAQMFQVAMSSVSDDVLFGYLQDLLALSLAAIPSADKALPNLVKIRVSAQLPTLVLAYDLMSGSVDESTVIELNGVRNPWMAPNTSGSEIVVLR